MNARLCTFLAVTVMLSWIAGWQIVGHSGNRLAAILGVEDVARLAMAGDLRDVTVGKGWVRLEVWPTFHDQESINTFWLEATAVVFKPGGSRVLVQDGVATVYHQEPLDRLRRSDIAIDGLGTLVIWLILIPVICGGLAALALYRLQTGSWLPEADTSPQKGIARPIRRPNPYGARVVGWVLPGRYTIWRTTPRRRVDINS